MSYDDHIIEADGTELFKYGKDALYFNYIVLIFCIVFSLVTGFSLYMPLINGTLNARRPTMAKTRRGMQAAIASTASTP